MLRDVIMPTCPFVPWLVSRVCKLKLKSISGASVLISLLECRDDASSNLKYHLSSEILEYESILLHYGHFGSEKEKIKRTFLCSKHRNVLGKHWKCGKSACQHPEHKGTYKAVKGGRVFPARLARDVFEIFGMIVPVGSREYFFQFLECEGSYFIKNSFVRA